MGRVQKWNSIINETKTLEYNFGINACHFSNVFEMISLRLELIQMNQTKELTCNFSHKNNYH